MLAYDDLRTGFRPFFRRARAARYADPAMFAAEIGEPAAFPTSGGGRQIASERGRVLIERPAGAVALPTSMLAPSGDGRLLRRLRHVVRRRVRIELEGLVRTSISDGDIDLDVRALSSRDPRIIEWSADRLVALVVLHDGCGARVIGGGGLVGRLELPSVSCDGAFLAFCYDGEAGAARSGAL
jgi:hypothetical protein